MQAGNERVVVPAGRLDDSSGKNYELRSLDRAEAATCSTKPPSPPLMKLADFPLCIVKKRNQVLSGLRQLSTR